MGLIEVKNGHARLVTPTYSTSDNPKETLERGAHDVADLLTALQQNALLAHDLPNLEARTEFDNVPDEALPTIRDWFLEAGSKLHEQSRIFLSKFDRDINSKQAKGTGRNRVVIGTYSLIGSQLDTTKGEKENE